MFKQTIFYPLQLFANNVFGTSLDVLVDCKKYSTGKFFIGLGETATQQKDVPYLDVSATYKDGEIVICVVNRNKDESITTDIISQHGTFSGAFSIYEVNGPDIKSANDFNKENVRTNTKPALNANGNQFTYTFPPHSFTLLKGKLKK
jgi:alpha-N-arabinofuranosidase